MATKNPRPPKQPNPLPNGYVSKDGGAGSGAEPYDAHDEFQAHYLPKEPRAMHIRVHVNKDTFEPGKKITIQKNKVKTFENFLNECTEKCKPPFGCARRLYTARGRHRIQNLDELQEDNVYVITGFEEFKRYPYRDISPTRPRLRGFKKIDISRIYTPVQHANEERLRQKSGRSHYLNEHRRGLRLRISYYGQYQMPVHHATIPFNNCGDLEKIMIQIERERQVPQIKQMFKVLNYGGSPDNFIEINDCQELSQEEHVLLTFKREDKNKFHEYYLPQGKRNFTVAVSPRHGPAYNFPSFPDQSTPKGKSGSLNKHRVLPSIGSSSKHSEPASPFSNPPNSQGSRKRGKGKNNVREVDYDQDQSGVYRAKKQNNARGAQQVNETRETRTEKPIDQMEAETVDEEEIHTKEKTTPIPPGTELNKQPSKDLKHSAGNKKGKAKGSKDFENSENGNQTRDEVMKEKGDPFHKLEPLPPIADEKDGDVNDGKVDDVKPEGNIRDDKDNDGGNQMVRDLGVDDTDDAVKIGNGVKPDVKPENDSKDFDGDNAERGGNAISPVSKDVKEGHVKETVEQFEQMTSDKTETKNVDGDKLEREETPDDLKFKNVMDESQVEENMNESNVETNRPPMSTSPPHVPLVAEQDQSYEEAGMRRIDEYDDSFNQYDRNSSQALNKEFRSSTPASRGESRQKREIKQHQAAVKIQAGARGYMERKKFNARKEEMKREKESRARDNQTKDDQKAGAGEQKSGGGQKEGMNEDEAATKIQASFKGYKTRKEMNVKKQQVRDSDELGRQEKVAATKIQSNYRGYKVRKDYNKRKNMRNAETKQETDINANEKKDDDKDTADAAVKIQSSYRGYRTRKELKGKKTNQAETEKDSSKKYSNDEAAIKIQAGYRGYKTRKDYSKKKALNKTDNSKEEDAAATKIQANYKGYKERQKYHKEKQQEVEDEAASNVQAAFRGYKTRQEISKDSQLPDQAPTPRPDSAEINKAATKIQSNYRGYRTRKEFKDKVIGDEIIETDPDQLPESVRTQLSANLEQSLLKDKGDNASTIQWAYRLFKDKQLVSSEQTLYCQDSSNIKQSKERVIASFKGYQSRKVEGEIKKNKANTNIQAHFRAFVVRHTKVYPYESVNRLHGAVRGYVTRKLNNTRWESFNRLQNVTNAGQYATVIQSLCRGFMTRRAAKENSLQGRSEAKSADSQRSSQGPTEVASPKSSKSEVSYWHDTNIRMFSDKTIRKSAARIQAAIYAFKTRQTYGRLKDHDEQSDAQEKQVSEPFSKFKINASIVVNAYFRGYQTRQRNKISIKEDKLLINKSDENNGQEEATTKEDTVFGQDVKDLKGKSTDYIIQVSIEEKKSSTSELQQKEINHERPQSASSQASRKSFMKSTKAENGSSEKDASNSEKLYDNDDTEVVDDHKFRSSTRLSETANSLRSSCLTISDVEHRKGSANSVNSWKSFEKLKAEPGEVEHEGESAREVEDEAGELSSIEKNVKAISHLQAAFRACQLRRELRRELSELNGGSQELMDIKNVDRAVSALRKEFRLRSAKVRRLGSYQFGKEKNVGQEKNWWDEENETKDDKSEDIKAKLIENDVETAFGGDSNQSPKNRENVSRIRAAMKGYLVRKKTRDERESKTEKARLKILAAFRGHVTRKTSERMKKAGSKRNVIGNDKKCGDEKMVVKTERLRSARSRSSNNSERTVFHVQMHSDVIKERVTMLQAAFAGYQTRKVHITLTKIVELNAHSNQNTSTQQLERMGSLSETDDFKLRHKCIAKIHALESQRFSQEKSRGSSSSTSVSLSKVSSLHNMNKHMVLPPIGHAYIISEERQIRPKSGVSLRSHASSVSLGEGKSKTQPDLYRRYRGSVESEKLNGIEVYIKKKVAATIVQACARGWIARQKYRALPRPHVTAVNGMPLRTISTSNNTNSPKMNNLPQGPSQQREDWDNKEGSVKSNETVKSEKGHRHIKSDRTSPHSSSSLRSTKIPLKSSRECRESTNKAKEEMTEMVRTRTASVKLEAERRKLIAERIRLQKGALEAKEVTTIVKKQAEMRKTPMDTPLKSTSPERLSPILSSRGNTDRSDLNEIDNVTPRDRERPNVVRTTEKACNQGRTEQQITAKKVEPQNISLKVFRSANTSSGGSVNNSSSDADHDKTGGAGPDQTDAAVTIQKLYRGHRARQCLVEKQRSSVQLETEYKDWKKKRIEAVVAIQSAWRGYSVRKDLNEQVEESIQPFNPFTNELPELLVINIGRSKSEIERADKQYENSSMLQMVFRASNVRRKLFVRAAVSRHDRNKAASRIQALYRGYLTRTGLKLSAAATHIQNVCKGYLSRLNNEERKKKHADDKRKAATLLQAAYLSFMRRRLNEAEKEERMRNNAAVDLQSAIRGFIVRWELGNRREQLQMVAANKIQECVRGFKARKDREELKANVEKIVAGFRSYKSRQVVQAIKDRLRREKIAATRVQAAYKAYMTRNSTKEYKAKMAREYTAASRLQSSIKGNETRKLYREKVKRRREASALKIQKVYRGHLGRKEAHDHKREASALKVQKVYRGHLGRKEAHGRKREASALKIQNVYRGHLGRVEALGRKRERAAIHIQSYYRGHLGRKDVRREREVRETREMAAGLVDLVVHRALDYIRRRNNSSERIQATVKGYCTRHDMMNKLIDDAKIKHKQKQVSATIIQAVVRAKQERKRQCIRRREEEQRKAVIKIQSLYRGYKIRQEIEKEKEMLANIEPPPSALISARTQSGKLLSISLDEVLLKNNRAIILFHKKASELQAAFRAKKVREQMKDRFIRKSQIAKRTPRRVLPVSKRLSREERAAILIQKIFRGYYERKVYLNAVRTKRKKENRAAKFIQASLMGFRNRQIEKKKWAKFGKEGMNEMFMIKYHAANVIACAYRSLAQRKHKKSLRVEM